MPAHSSSAASSLTLAEFTSPGLILPQLRGPDLAAAVQELSVALGREHRVPDWLRFYHAALNREFLSTTALMAHLAFPHALVNGLPRLSFALGKSPKPIAWAPNHSVRMVFLSAVPADDSTNYLALISGFARLSNNSRLLQQLDAAETSQEIMSVLEQTALRLDARTLN